MHYRDLALDEFQERAIKALQRGRSVLVCAPTGTGKTIIADWIVEQALADDKQVIYTAPIKALSNQKYRDYVRLHGENNVGLVTGDLVIRRDAPCLVMTTEILRNILLNGDTIDRLAAVVLDEIHFLDDRERGTVWEEVLIYLPADVAIVGLSATLSNVHDFAAWLEHVRGSPVDVIEEHRRAVPLELALTSAETGPLEPQKFDKAFKRKGGAPTRSRGAKADRRGGGGRGGRQGGGQGGGRMSHIDIFRQLDDRDLLPYLYFVFSRRDTELYARSLARVVQGSLLPYEDRGRSEARLAAAAAELGPVLDDELRELYAAGIAFHHAGLHVQLKTLVESLYEDRLLKVLYCTSTFALGINMPARSVVFDGIKKYDGRSVAPLSTREFMQMAGRAGRRGMDDVGYVIVKMDLQDYPELKPMIDRYVRGNYEPVRSAFSLSFHSILNLIVRYSQEEIREIVDKSFLTWNAQRVREQALTTEKRKGRAMAHANRMANRTWNEYETKVSYLQHVGYLADDLSFNAGARVLQHLQISELFVTELVLSGILEDLTMDRLFGVLCGLTNELPRHAHAQFRTKPEDRELARSIARIKESGVVMDAEGLGAEVVWDPDVMIIGQGWAAGRPLLELVSWIHSDTDLSGDLVTGFRRAKDLAGQLREVYAEIPDRTAALGELVRRVSRDEVEVVG